MLWYEFRPHRRLLSETLLFVAKHLAKNVVAKNVPQYTVRTHTYLACSLIRKVYRRVK